MDSLDNVLNNYTNRAGADIDMTELMKSYAAAVAISGAIAVGSGVLMSRVPALQRLSIVVPYIAVATAGSCNVALTRMDEIRNGVVVALADGTPVGTSILAGREAVWQTVTTRSMFLPIPILLLPPAIMKVLRAALSLRAGPAAMALETVVIAGCLGVALPMALAINPQLMSLDVDNLEPEFRNLTDAASGERVRHVYAAKGL